MACFITFFFSMLISLVCSFTTAHLRANPTNQAWDAAHYVKFSTNCYQPLIETIISNLNFSGNELVHDIGCGDGRITRKIAQLIPDGEILGSDYSQDMISFAQHQYKDFKNMKFQAIDAAKLDYHNKFDVVFSFACLHWIPDHHNMLKRMYLSLKSKGKIALLLSTNDRHPFYVAVNQTAHSAQWKHFYSNSDIQFAPWFPQDSYVYQTMLEKIGFQAEVSSIEFSLTFKHPQELINWITGWIGGSPYVYTLPKDLRSQFVQECVMNYLKVVNEPRYNLPFILVTGHK